MGFSAEYSVYMKRFEHVRFLKRFCEIFETMVKRRKKLFLKISKKIVYKSCRFERNFYFGFCFYIKKRKGKT